MDEGDILARLQQTLDSDPENPSHHFNIGVFLWNKADEVDGDDSKVLRARASEHFVASAKLNPCDGAAFRFLGHYYGGVVADAQRASKCYQRALSLNPDDFEAGEGFCDLLDGDGKESLEISVCKEASEKSPRAFWAFRRLGYLQVHHKKWEVAVQSLQHAIRGYPACADLWETLGHAYHRLGRFTAAIKSYGRAIELENSRIYSIIESGNILLMLGSFRQGIEHFRNALEISPHDVSAHFGLASGLLGLSKECASRGAYKWGATLLKDASDIAKACTMLSSNFSSVWKLHGDIQLAEFQIGLGIMAALSGHLSSPQVFAAIRHSIQRSPYYPESHNLNGLICEARSDYQSAVSAYRLARSALKISSISQDVIKPCFVNVSVNLARALCQSGNMLEAEQECEALDKDGMLDCKGLQIYAVSLWKLGKNEQALNVARNLAKNVSTMEKTSSSTAAIGLICQLIYYISGLDSAVSTILKLPQDYLHGEKMTLIISAVNALDPNNRLQMLLPPNLISFEAYDVVVKMHTITAMNKMIFDNSEQILDIHSGAKYLRRVLHLYPDSILIRNHLGWLLLYSEDWLTSHIATRVTVVPSGLPVRTGLISQFEIHGCAGVACHASCVTRTKFSFPTCKCQPMHGLPVTDHLQKWLHQEPWNHEARYLLILNVLQRAREEKFPSHLCLALKRLIAVALYGETSMMNEARKYQRFLVLLCASEISLQCADYAGCTSYTTNALRVLPSYGDTFFVHLQLCRSYAAQEDLTNLRKEYINCINVKTTHQIGWLSLKFLESRYQLQDGYSTVDVNFKKCCSAEGSYSQMWEAVFGLVCALCCIWNKDFFSAEQALADSCAIAKAESCILLAHGAVCMELARQQKGSQFLSRAVRCLVKAQGILPFPLPILSALLAQAEGSVGAKAKWERNLRLEWFSWPAEMRPAELYFQMHILARQTSAASNQQTNIESYQSPDRWVLQAIHLNPSCWRYWKILQKLIGES